MDPSYGRTKAGRPAQTYIPQLCEGTGCSPEDLPEAMNNREEWRERVRDIRAGSTTWWWWWLLCILWDDWSIFMISGSNEQLQQESEYTLLSLIVTAGEFKKMQSGPEDTSEERDVIEFCFKLRKNSTETYGMVQTAFRPSCMNRASVFEWHKRFKEARESVRDERCRRSKEVNRLELIGQRLRVRLLWWDFRGVQEEIPLEEASTLEIGSVAFPPGQTPVHNSVLVTDYLTKMGIKTVPQPLYSPDLAPSDFGLFPKLRGCRYETIEEMKEAVTKVIDTLPQEVFDEAFRKLLEQYNKCIAAGGDYFEGD